MLRAKTFQFSVLVITAVVFLAFLFYFDFFKPVKILVDPPLTDESDALDKESDQANEKIVDENFHPEEEYEIIEQMLRTCSKPTDCVLPTEYMTRSSCRYELRCINEVCTVICPAPFEQSGSTTAANSKSSDTSTSNSRPIGGDKDEHGCIGSAGYSWCEAKQKCLRSWEEKCLAGDAVITNFEECEKSGFPVMESYPRQCRVPSGETFVEKIDSPAPIK